jgi:hypothetical protein
MLYFSHGRIVNNSLQTSNLQQGNIKLIVASRAPLRYYFNRPAEVSVTIPHYFCLLFNVLQIFFETKWITSIF